MPRGGKRAGAGRPRGSRGSPPVQIASVEQKRDLRLLARKHTSAALDALVKICTSGESEAARVSAASVLLDRGYGKPGQHVELDITHYDRMTEAELEAIIEDQVLMIASLRGHGQGKH